MMHDTRPFYGSPPNTIHVVDQHILLWDFVVSAIPPEFPVRYTCRLVAVCKRHLPSKHSPFVITRTSACQQSARQSIHYALGDEAVPPSHQPTGNHSITTRSLPLFPTMNESNPVPPPTLLDGTLLLHGRLALIFTALLVPPCRRRLLRQKYARQVAAAALALRSVQVKRSENGPRTRTWAAVAILLSKLT